MMQLYTPSLSINAKKEIREVLKNADPSFNKTAILKMMVRDGFDDLDWRELQAFFRRVAQDNSSLTPIIKLKPEYLCLLVHLFPSMASRFRKR